MDRPKFLYILYTVLFIVGLLFAGCGNSPQAGVDGAYLTLTDDNGRQVSLAKKPDRIVALSASFLEPLQAVGANVVGRPSSQTAVPEAARTIEEVGAVYQINIEKVVALQPDLVIAYKGMNDKFVPILESNHIPVLVVDMKTYDDVKEKIRLFAELTGEKKKGADLVKSMDDKIAAIQSKLPAAVKRIAILHSTAQSLTVQLDGSIAGSVAKMLGFENVAAASQPLEGNPNAAPYSLETLVKQNPDIIFVTSMGDVEAIKQSMQQNMAANPAWQTLPAAAGGQLYFLPQSLFLLNPGIHYPEAVASMAKLAYPGVFDDAE